MDESVEGINLRPTKNRNKATIKNSINKNKLRRNNQSTTYLIRQRVNRIFLKLDSFGFQMLTSGSMNLRTAQNM